MLKNKQVNNISVLYIYIISILTRTNNVIHIYTTKAAHSSPMSLSHYSHYSHIQQLICFFTNKCIISSFYILCLS